MLSKAVVLTDARLHKSGDVISSRQPAYLPPWQYYQLRVLVEEEDGMRTTQVRACVRVCDCVFFKGVCHWSLYYRCQTQNPSVTALAHIHFKVGEGYVHPWRGGFTFKLWSPGSVRECFSGCHQLLSCGVVPRNHECNLQWSMRKCNKIYFFLSWETCLEFILYVFY